MLNHILNHIYPRQIIPGGQSEKVCLKKSFLFHILPVMQEIARKCCIPVDNQ